MRIGYSAVGHELVDSCFEGKLRLFGRARAVEEGIAPAVGSALNS